MKLDLTNREVEVIRQALRGAEEAHKRNDFKALVLEVQGLRSKVNDAMISEVANIHNIRHELNQLMSEIQTPIKG